MNSPTAEAKAPEAFRYDECGQIRLLARASGYVMVQHPYCMPYVLTEKQWEGLSKWPLRQRSKVVKDDVSPVLASADHKPGEVWEHVDGGKVHVLLREGAMLLVKRWPMGDYLTFAHLIRVDRFQQQTTVRAT